MHFRIKSISKRSNENSILDFRLGRKFRYKQDLNIYEIIEVDIHHGIFTYYNSSFRDKDFKISASMKSTITLFNNGIFIWIN